MKLKITQKDIDTPTARQLNTGSECIVAIAAKRAFKGSKKICVAYDNWISVDGIIWDGDKDLKEFLLILKLVSEKQISRKWLKPASFILTQYNE